MKNIAIIYSNTNKHGKKDATGAFIPEAKAFQTIWGVPDQLTLGIDCNKLKAWERRKMVCEHIYACGRNVPLEGIAFFGHGWPNGIQFGILKKHLPELVTIIANTQIAISQYFPIVIYSCLTAENEIRDSKIQNIGAGTKGGFADRLAQLLGQKGIEGHVDAHKTAGHTTENPYVVRFLNDRLESRAAWLIEPKSTYWYRWSKALKGTNLKYEFPFMTDLSIRMELEDPGKLLFK